VAIRVAILASGTGTTAQAVIDACAQGRIDGAVALVIANNADAPVLERALRAGIPTRHLSRVTHPDPRALDAAIVAAAHEAGATHLLLAGYMRKLGAGVLDAYAGRIYNTHPALLPAYGGQGMYGDRVHAAVLADGRSRSGATVHLVSAEYDAGPIVRAVEVAVLPGDDVASLGERVRAAERELVVEVLAGLAAGPDVAIRPLEPGDLDEVFEQMRDPESVRMAAFTREDPDDRDAFDAHMAKVMRSPENTLRAIVSGARLVGTIASFPADGATEVTYWVDRRCWGQGIASRALGLLLAQTPTRPLRARAASDNAGSLRVLEKAGFRPIGTERSFAAGRAAEIEETILELP